MNIDLLNEQLINIIANSSRETFSKDFDAINALYKKGAILDYPSKNQIKNVAVGDTALIVALRNKELAPGMISWLWDKLLKDKSLDPLINTLNILLKEPESIKKAGLESLLRVLFKDVPNKTSSEPYQDFLAKKNVIIKLLKDEKTSLKIYDLLLPIAESKNSDLLNEFEGLEQNIQLDKEILYKIMDKLWKQLQETSEEGEKKKTYELLEKFVNFFKKSKEFDKRRFYKRCSTMEKFLPLAIKDGNLEAALFFIKDFATNNPNRYIKADVLVEAYRSPHKKELLDAIEALIGTQDHVKVNHIIQTNLRNATTRDFVNFIKLPLRWTNKEAAEMIREIDQAPLVRLEYKSILKKIFMQTMDTNTKEKVETLWKHYTSKEFLLDNRLFANIHNDPNLQGTHIQGGSISNSIIYLRDLISKISSRKIEIPGLSQAEQKAYAEHLEPLDDKLADCLEIENKLLELISHPDILDDSKPNAFIFKLSNQIIDLIIDSLTNKRSILFPGGWIGINEKPGHAMLYEFKIVNEKLVFLVHNMGAGISFHDQRDLENQHYYSSVMAFECPFTDINQMKPQLSNIINQLLKPKYLPIKEGSSRYDAEEVYKIIKDAPLSNSFKEIDPLPYSKEWTVSQLSGTCGFRIFESYLINFPYSGTLNDSDLRYEIYRASLKEFFQENIHQLTDPTVHRLINFALQNFALMLRNLSQSIPPLLKSERIKAGIAMTQEIRDALSKALEFGLPDNVLPQYVASSHIQKPKTVKRSQLLPRLQGQFKTKEHVLNKIDLKSNQTNFALLERSSGNLKNIVDKLEDMLAICKKNSDSGFHQQVIHDIQDFYAKFPIDSSLWKDLGKESLEKCLTIFQKLQYFYGKSIATHDPKPYAERQITLLTGQMIAFDVFSALYEDQPILVKDIAARLYTKTKPSFNSSKNSPYFCCLDSSHRSGIKKIETGFKQLHTKMSSSVLSKNWFSEKQKSNKRSFVHSIVCSNPEDKKSIIELCEQEIQAIKKKHEEDPDREYFSEKIILDIEKTTEDDKATAYYIEKLKDSEGKFTELRRNLSNALGMLQIGHAAHLAIEGKMDALNYTPEDNLEYITSDDFDITKDKLGNRICELRDPMDTKFYSKKIDSLESTQLAPKDKQVKNTLEKEENSSNDIQVETMEALLTSRVNLLRTLKNIRLDPETQFSQTIDFMKKEFFILDNPDIQAFGFLNLFKTPLFENELEKSPTLIFDLLTIIEEGLKNCFKYHVVRPEALFFLKIAVSMQTLFASFPDQLKNNAQVMTALKRIEETTKRLDELIVAYQMKVDSDKASKNPLDNEILLELHTFNILRTGASPTKEDLYSTKELSEILNSIFHFTNQSAGSFSDPNIRNYASDTIASLQEKLKKTLDLLNSNNKGKKELDDLLNTIVGKLGARIDRKGSYWKVESPWIRLISEKDNKTMIALNLLNGRVAKETLEKVPLPYDIYQNSDFKSAFGEQKGLFGYASPDRDVYEVEINNVTYRLVFKGHFLTIQRSVDINGDQNWYQHTDPYYSEFPKSMMDKNHLYWVGLEKQPNGGHDGLIIDQSSGRLEYHYEGYDNSKIHELDAQGNKTRWHLINPESLDAFFEHFPEFEHFEDKQYIWIFKSDDPSEIRIDFPRYNISFKSSLNPDGSHGDLIWQEDPRYRLKLEENLEHIPNFKAILHLTPISRPTVPGQVLLPNQETISDQVLIPKQMFKATNKEEGEYYQLDFDKEDSIPFDMLFNNKIYNRREVSDNMTMRGSAEYVRYSVVDSGLSLKPHSNSSHFYLTYLNLAKRQPLIAFRLMYPLLQDGKPFSEEELEGLRRIIQEVPAKLQSRYGDNAIEKDAQIDTPEFVAVRALGFALMALQKNQGNKIKFSKPKFPQDVTRNPQHDYQCLRQKQLKQFWKNEVLAYTMLALMKDYYKMRPHIPASMLLNETQEELEMLRYIMSFKKNIPVNIRHRRRELELKKLVWDRDVLLTDKSKQEGKLSAEQNKRLELLEYRINHYPKIQRIFTSERPSHLSLEVSVPLPTRKEELLSPPKIHDKMWIQKPVELEKEAFRKLFQENHDKLKKGTHVERLAKEAFPLKETNEPALNSLYQETQEEYHHGLLNNQLIKARSDASKDFYLNMLAKDNGMALGDKIKKNITEAKKVLEKMKNEILAIANRPPTDPTQLNEWTLKKIGLKIDDLKFEDILRLFLKRDKSLYSTKTTLDGTEIAELHQKIFEFLMLSTDTQYHERLYSTISDLSKVDATPEEVESSKEHIGMLLSMERNFSPEAHPELLLFEYLDNKIIYPEQARYLKTLMERDKGTFNSQIIKLIMGGGKSKIIQPLLSLKKATGTNLVVMFVPEALYEINRADLNATTLRLFGCQAHAFHFDDSVKCTSHYLLNLKRRLKTIMQNREYIVTTKESFQSLESKYLTLLRYGDIKKKNVKNMLKHFSDILRIIKHQGDFLIDEVDSTLDVRKQLIHPTGKVRHLTSEIAETGVGFFRFLEELNISVDSKGKFITLKEIMTREKTPSEREWVVMLEDIARKAVLEKTSPLAPYLSSLFKEGFLKESQEALIEYLLGRSKTIPKFIQDLNVEEPLQNQIKEMIAFYRLELQVSLPLKSLLPSTLSKKKNENFGATHDPKMPAEMQELAIPYAASDVPNEGSRFKNPIETLNYTIQMHYGMPLSKETLAKMVSKFKVEHEEEKRQGRAGKKYSAEARFLELTGQSLEVDASKGAKEHFCLDSVDLNNPISFERFYNAYCQDPAVKRYCMTYHILSNIEENEEYLTSDAHNFCGQGRTVQGMTGTDWNKRCLPKYINTQQALVGSDGQVMDYLLRTAVPPHLLSSVSKERKRGTETKPQERTKPILTESSQQSINMAINLLDNHPSKEKFHAWIDLGAHFRGVSNLEVAEQFSHYFKDNPRFKHLRFVLYFDSSGKPFAQPIEGGTPIHLEETSPEYIKAKLDAFPNEYFVFYDQRRTTGTDIKQASDAQAFVTLGADTLKRDLLQASMRMRELRDKQRVELVIPKECQDVHSQVTEWSVKTVIDMCQGNEDNRLIDDHFRSAIQEMKQLVRNDCMQIILNQKKITYQHNLIKTFHESFFSRISNSLFELYGGIPETKSVSEILEEQKKNLINQWSGLLEDAGMEPSEDEIKAFSSKMQAIVDAALPWCRKTMQKGSEQAENLELDSAVQVETTETQTTETAEQEQQTQELNYKKIETAMPASQDFLENIPNFGDPSQKFNQDFITLEEMSQDSGSLTQSGKLRVTEKSFKFPNNLMATPSFANTLTLSNDRMNGYKKDNVFFLVEYKDQLKPNPINILLLTTEEAALLGKELQQSPNENYWIESTHQTLHAGRKPNILPPEYYRAVEQVAFFNGDTDILYKGLNPDSWLKTETLEKLKYLERVIQPLHLDKANILKPLYTEALRLFTPASEEQSARKTFLPLRETQQIKERKQMLDKGQEVETTKKPPSTPL